jgi:tetratricopeptide (TPR) repeat protein
VLILAGADAYTRHDLAHARQLWRAAYNTGPECQRKMVLLLAGRVPVSVFLEEFQPDLKLLGLLEYRYSQIQLESELATLRRYAAARAVAAARNAEREATFEAGELWLQALGWYRKLEEHEAAAACGRRAVALNPLDFKTRHLVGRQLSHVEDFAEAERHLQWCVDHKPGDPQLRKELQKAMTGRMRTATAESAERGRTAK